MQALLVRGAKIELSDTYGSTALMMASLNGYDEFVKTYIAGGAEVNQQDESGETALSKAKTEQIKQILKEAGATR